MSDLKGIISPFTTPFSENGEIANILLEPNDTIVIPEVTDLVHVGGEVLLPQSVVFNPDATTEDYVAWAGGFTERAEDERILIVRKNGNVTFTSINDSFLSSNDRKLEPGDQIRAIPTSNATPNIDVLCTVTETFIPVG